MVRRAGATSGPDIELTPAQKFSQVVFGRKYHLQVLEHISSLGDGGSFTVTDLMHVTGAGSISSLNTTVDALLKAGFIREVPGGAGSDRRTQPMTAAGSRLWAFVEEVSGRRAAFEAAGRVGVEHDQPIQPPLFPG